MTRVLIIDDSAVARQIIRATLLRAGGFDVVGEAADPYVAREQIANLRPDVLTLDMEMPRMDGLTFLEKVMAHHPMPIVVVSSLTPANSETALRALELGAVEVIEKGGTSYSTPDPERLVRAVRAAGRANVTRREVKSTRLSGNYRLRTTHKVVAIGASTGGTQAIEAVLKAMPVTAPGIVVVQHMPKTFTKPFADRLNRVTEIEVREARDGDHVVPGLALIAPGDTHTVLEQSGARYIVRVKNGPHVYHQRPSVEVLFQSVARNAGRNSVGVMLTGMGSDGAPGMLAMRESGAYTIAQDEKSCVVFGMPKEAINLGGVQEIVSLSEVASAVLRAASK